MRFAPRLAIFARQRPKKQKMPFEFTLGRKKNLEGSVFVNVSIYLHGYKQEEKHGGVKLKAPGTSASMLHMDEMGRLDEILKKLKGCAKLYPEDTGRMSGVLENMSAVSSGTFAKELCCG